MLVLSREGRWLTQRPPHRSVRAALLHTAPTSDTWRRSVASRTSSKSLDALVRLCVRGAVACPMFSLVGRLPSIPCAGGFPPLFGHFVGTTRPRLPIDVRVGLLAQGLLQPARHTFHDGRRWGLPVLARGVSIHAWGLRLRGVLRMLAIAHPSVLPSAMRNDVGTPVAIIWQLNTQPACAPVNASPTALQLPTHDSGSGWLATPFPRDSFIHNSTPVYPGALRKPARQRLQRRNASPPGWDRTP